MSNTGDLGFDERDCENALRRIFILADARTAGACAGVAMSFAHRPNVGSFTSLPPPIEKAPRRGPFLLAEGAGFEPAMAF